MKSNGDLVRREIEIDDQEILVAALGPGLAYLKSLEREADVEIGVRGNRVLIHGAPEAAARAERILRDLCEIAQSGRALKEIDVVRGARILGQHPHLTLKQVLNEVVLVTSGRRIITPKSLNQKIYVELIKGHDLVFAVGPAGTGKTYLAMATAVAALYEKRFKRIVLTRPAVEAGEKLGFLPGDLIEKVNPYLRPMYDALHDMMDIEKAQALIGQGVIEVAPLAFMRGRTLNDAFVILDEAQNTTSEQMKMFLTRIGYSSKAVVTGDITQVDLPDRIPSGLVEARRILRGIQGIAFADFTDEDVVRHPLVQEIIKAYERNNGAGEGHA